MIAVGKNGGMIAGNATKDAEYKSFETKSGKTMIVCTINLAVGKFGEEAQYATIKCTFSLAIHARDIKKGDTVMACVFAATEREYNEKTYIEYEASYIDFISRNEENDTNEKPTSKPKQKLEELQEVDDSSLPF